MTKKSNSESAKTGAKEVSGGDCPSTSSPVRDRTLRHMRKLLVKTAAAGAMLSVSGSSGPCIVCDPLPPPVDCSADLTSDYLSQWVSWHAKWVQRDSSFAIEINLLIAPSTLVFTGDPALQGATLVESDNIGTTLTFTCLPVQGATSVTVAAPISCSEVNDTFQLLLDISGTPQVDKIIPATVGE